MADEKTQASSDIQHVLFQVGEWADGIADETSRTSQEHLLAIQIANLIRRTKDKLREDCE